ncbi:hypothetical protein [Rhizobacter sp. OV335]|uniref:hypothetical protein n=1 Tax=Rhizobacter sp. OV335 TaxID=1500264 RepID=UPI00091919C0|nr:hypothetical protein [Rhizobacter sp. OV335]SHN31433.1 hypothetical protein SAMN02787076_05044 [Rhizobacter sp. OV335]
MRHLLSLLIASTLTLGSIGIATSKPIDGCYLEPHSITLAGEASAAPDERLSVVDHLGLRQDSETTYEFDLLVIGDYGHVCQANGHLETFKKGGREVFSLVPDEDSQARQERGEALCRLTVEIKPKSIVVLANGACNDQFACGVRAGIYDRYFRRSSAAHGKSKKPCFQNAF